MKKQQEEGGVRKLTDTYSCDLIQKQRSSIYEEMKMLEDETLLKNIAKLMARFYDELIQVGFAWLTINPHRILCQHESISL